ncbi:MAG: DedA family protein [Succinivibrio sp.]|nr:DedA family protein [Succinivibrio sp.]
MDFLVNFFTDYGYTAVFTCLLLCGLGVPVPEDITLVSGGIISGLYEGINVHLMLAVGLAGVLLGDSTMFLGGRIFGYRIQRVRLFRRILSPKRFSQVQRHFKKYGLGVLFVARFLPGLRSPIFLAGGMSRRIPYLYFLIIDGAAALISVPVWVYLGYFFADNRDLLMNYVHDVQSVIYLILALIALVAVAVYVKKKIKARFSRGLEDEDQQI